MMRKGDSTCDVMRSELLMLQKKIKELLRNFTLEMKSTKHRKDHKLK